MPQWIAVSSTTHAGCHYHPREGYRHSQGRQVTPVLLAELPRLVAHYVIGFMPRGDGYLAVALLGIEKDTNHYLHPDGRWLGTYVPASLRGHPFAVAPNEQGQSVLCIDADHLVDGTAAGEPLLDADGAPTEGVARYVRFLNECEANRQQTQTAVDALQRAGLLAPWRVEVEDAAAGASRSIDGLCRVDEQTLNALDPTAYHALQGPPMALAHAHLFSAHQTGQLAERARWQARQSSAPATTGLHGILGGADDDTLKFDFE